MKAKKKSERTLVARQHAFELNHETRRMVCVDCEGVMNECHPSCSGLGDERRATLAKQFTRGLAELVDA